MKRGKFPPFGYPSIVSKEMQYRYKEDGNGTKRWFKENTNIPHRLGGPAVEYADGGMIWCENGKLHRIGGPAVEYASDNREWWENGKRHRLGGGPAVEKSGYQSWWENDKLHRIGGPAIEDTDGYQAWYKNGKLHRIGGPAVEYASGRKEWWENGKLHHLGGDPAIVNADGTQEWWVNGEEIKGETLTMFKQAISHKTLPEELCELSHNENSVVAQAAVHNPNCPLEAKVEWALRH